ncbi:MAG TPA: histidinol phosphate phosphatase, partial [Eubacterium sp.]|nr:histidinol phosphate phosphatase [Eubacterium sp.]
DDESRIREYVDTVIEGMKTGMYSYLAHPDLINYQGLDSVYEWEMTRMCKALKEL